MSFRDDRDAMLARLDALERELADRDHDLDEANAELAALKKERDGLRKKVAKQQDKADKPKREAKAKKRRDKSKKRSPRRDLDGAGRSWARAWLAENGATLAIVGAIAGIVGWVYLCNVWQHRPPPLDAKSSGLYYVCGLHRNKPLITIDVVKKTHGSKTTYTHRYYFLSVTDPKTGKRLARQRLKRRMRCYFYDDDLIWLKGGSKLRAYRVSTGKLVYRYSDLLAKLPAGYHASGISGHHLYIRGSDGRKYFVSTQDGLTVSTTPPPPRATTNKKRPVSPAATATIAGTGPRRFVQVNGARVGSRDFLKPMLLKNPAEGGTVWHHPDSVLVVEPTQLRSKTFRVTRLGLDGTKLWTYRGPGPSFTRQRPFWVLPDASLVLYFTNKAELIGLDPATGRERYHVHL